MLNAEGPVPQLVLDPSIKMLAANGWAEEAELPVSLRQASRCRRGERFVMLQRKSPQPREISGVVAMD